MNQNQNQTQIKQNQKIGIMGGTFNPIHNSHIYLACKALSCFNLDKVLFIPNHIPPHKRGSIIETDEDRLNMVKLAIDSIKGFELCDIEIKREGLSYTSDTIIELSKIYPDSKLFFIMGSDSFLNLHIWHKPDVILKNSSVIVFIRKNIINHDDLSSDNIKQKIIEQIKYFEEMYNSHILTCDADVLPISSTYLRENIKNQEIVKKYLPEKVYEYIKKHNLYGINVI